MMFSLHRSSKNVSGTNPSDGLHTHDSHSKPFTIIARYFNNTAFVSRFLHSRISVITMTAILFELSLLIRLFRFEDRAWFSGDGAKELLFAWNIATTKTPMLISMVSSGTTFNNLPTYINFLGFLTWICANDPMRTATIVTCIEATVVPILFLCGLLEGSWLAGIISAVAFMIFPGTISMSNVWGNFLAFVPGISGVFLYRYGTLRKTNSFRAIGLFFLCTASAFHFSYCALLGSIILVDFIQNENWKILIRQTVFSFFVLMLYALPTLVELHRLHQLTIPRIKYYSNVCPYCATKIPTMIGSTFNWLFESVLHQHFSLPILSALAICFFVLVIFKRKRLLSWVGAVSVFFLLIAHPFTGQAAYWYLFPLIPFIFSIFGDILASGIHDSNRFLKGLAITTIFLFFSATYLGFRNFYTPFLNFRTVQRNENAIRNTMSSIHVQPADYIEYVDLLNPSDPSLFDDSSPFWLIRQWKYGENLTYNDALNHYYPALINPMPRVRVAVYPGCTSHSPEKQTDWMITEGYEYVRHICIEKEDLSLWMYSRIPILEPTEPPLFK